MRYGLQATFDELLRNGCKEISGFFVPEPYLNLSKIRSTLALSRRLNCVTASRKYSCSTTCVGRHSHCDFLFSKTYSKKSPVQTMLQFNTTLQNCSNSVAQKPPRSASSGNSTSSGGYATLENALISTDCAVFRSSNRGLFLGEADHSSINRHIEHASTVSYMSVSNLCVFSAIS